jgi:hypothetical protein
MSTHKGTKECKTRRGMKGCKAHKVWERGHARHKRDWPGCEGDENTQVCAGEETRKCVKGKTTVSERKA